jgi:hypothetical protein
MFVFHAERVAAADSSTTPVMRWTDGQILRVLKTPTRGADELT